jgi:hypothetical protein
VKKVFPFVLAVPVFLLFLIVGFAQEEKEKKTIQWLDGKGVELEDKKKQKETPIFEDIDVLSGKKLTRPIMIYFYFPKIEDGKKAKKEELKQFKSSEAMEQKIFSKKEIVEKSEEFICVKVNIKDFPKSLKDKYKVKTAPIVLFYDCVGKNVGKLSDPAKDTLQLLIELSEIVKNSDEEREKVEKGEKK